MVPTIALVLGVSLDAEPGLGKLQLAVEDRSGARIAAGATVKTVDLGQQEVDLSAVLTWARQEPVLLVTLDGREFYLAEADDFEREVETLRQSRAFQDFLESRSACSRRMPLEEIERGLQELP